jgi:hypothetical protein
MVRGRSSDRSDTHRPTFGRVDPFCWLAVVPGLLVAVWLSFGGVPQLGIPLAFVAIGLAFFDAWINRPPPPTSRRSTPTPTSPPHTQAPRTQAPPSQAPRSQAPRTRAPGGTNTANADERTRNQRVAPSQARHPQRPHDR